MNKSKIGKKNHFWLDIIKRYKYKQIAAAICLLINSLTSLSVPYLLIKIIDDVIPDKDLIGLRTIILIYFGFLFIQCITKFCADYLYAIIGKKVVYDVRFAIVNHLMKLSGDYYSNCSTGEILTTINDDVSAIEEFSTKTLYSLFSDILMAIIMFFFLMNLQIDLLFVAVIFQPILYILHKYYDVGVKSPMNHQISVP